MTTSAESLIRNSLYLAAVVEKKINEYSGVMPLHEKKTLAQNLGELLVQAKKQAVKKNDIVVKSGIRHNPDAPVNALGEYCLLPEAKSRRTKNPRLCAHPQPYLRLALAAAELMGMAPHDAIMRLTEGSNAFSAQDAIDEELFSPTQAVWRLLKAKLAVIAERHQLKQYFRDAYAASAVYDEDIFKPNTWEQDSVGLSTSYWPTVYLCAVIRSSASARLTVDNIDVEVGGQVHAIEQVFLTLGWCASGWIVGYLEYLPGLAVEPIGLESRRPLFDLHISGETFTNGAIGDISFVIEDGESIKVPDGTPGEWPYRLRSRKRFESLTPQQLASTFIGTRLIATPNQALSKDIDTAVVLSVPNSPLAILEAQLLGRQGLWPNREIPCFLDALEKDIVLLKTSFQEWRQSCRETAKNDHFAVLAAATEELNRLRTDR
ncbi:hypothetical protein SAMN05216344_11483 [Polaromonas sp. OV174]|uniref:hypothetical protein n=1 Tax=Polaromonas sp. OV174 TaxID=1855300 RepID=UPI0008EFA6DC|nr:hypothetical protein [Polaromonas sp. OV174]SFC33791.1 hypothetical protein SAMN05216344_11483 [Polaromonas sp. OV174]